MEAFATLFEPLRPKIHAVACRFVGHHDAEDVTMDTFLKAWRALPGFRRGSSLSTWLVRIVRNQALDLLRSRAGREGRTDSLDEAGAVHPSQLSDPGAVPPADLLAVADDRRMCRAALERLDEKHRVILLMRYMDELSYAEMAAAVNVSIGTVMSRLFHARRKMVQLMNEQEHIAGAGRPDQEGMNHEKMG